MGFFRRLFGNDQTDHSADDEAVERYRYLLRTAPPERIEQVHREAFAALTPQQRQLLFDELNANAPAGDAPTSADAGALATSATRAELRHPGTVERSLNGAQATLGAQNPARAAPGGGAGFGGTFASSMLGSVAGYVVGSAIMSSFLPVFDGFGGDVGGTDTWGADSAEAGTAIDEASFTDQDFGDLGGFNL